MTRHLHAVTDREIHAAIHRMEAHDRWEHRRHVASCVLVIVLDVLALVAIALGVKALVCA